MERDSTTGCLLFRLLRDCSSQQNSLDEKGQAFFIHIIAADTGIPYELLVGDSVELIGSICLYNGGKIIHGSDTGRIMDMRDKVERLAIKWQQARFSGHSSPQTEPLKSEIASWPARPSIAQAAA